MNFYPNLLNGSSVVSVLLLQPACTSLKSIWEKSFDLAWQFALETVRDDYPQFTFPDTWQFERQIDVILNIKFWEVK